MRILFTTQHIHFPQGGGGLERNTHELCLSLKRLGHLPGVMCSLHPDWGYVSVRNRAMRGLTGRAFPSDTICGYSTYRGWAEKGVGDVATDFKPDVAIVQSLEPAMHLEVFAAHGIPCLVYVHEVEHLGPLRAVKHLRVPFLANSRFTAERLQAQCGVDARVVRPLIEPSHYRTPTNPKRVLFINTMARKGVEVAFSLAQARPDIPFDFAQNWTHTAEQVRQLRARAEAAGNVTLHAPTNDMRTLYATARLLLAPSQWEETWGRVATEAQINGIPVLGSNRGGLPEAIGPGGLIVRADAPISDWQEALGRLWDDPSTYERCASEARAHAQRSEIQPTYIVADFLRHVEEAVRLQPSSRLA